MGKRSVLLWVLRRSMQLPDPLGRGQPCRPCHEPCLPVRGQSLQAPATPLGQRICQVIASQQGVNGVTEQLLRGEYEAAMITPFLVSDHVDLNGLCCMA